MKKGLYCLFAILVSLLLFSCVDEQKLPICRITISEEAARRFDTPVYESILPSDALEVKAVPAGNNTSAYTNAPDYVLLSSLEDGLLLSQGRWNIYCKWIFTGSEGTEITVTARAENTFVSLGTSTIYVTLDSYDKGSIIYTYYASTSSGYSIQTRIVGLDSSYDQYISGVSIATPKVIANLDSGKYMVLTYIVNRGTTIFYDSIAVNVYGACTTTVVGHMGDANFIEEYLPENPGLVGIKEEGDIHTEFEDGKVYQIQINNYDLTHSTNGDKDSPRITAPDSGLFGIDLNGNKVRVSNQWNSGSVPEATSVIELKEDVTLTLYNSKVNNTSNWGEGYSMQILLGGFGHDAQYMTRDNDNIKIYGGTLNVFGTGGADSMGNVVVMGPHVNNKLNSEKNHTSKQGAVNLEGTGGKVNFIGESSIGQSLYGITSTTNFGTSNLSSSAPMDTTISFSKGASINVVGDQSEPCYGMNITRDSYDAQLDDNLYIELDNASIKCESYRYSFTAGKVRSSTRTNNANNRGIRLENLHGTAEKPITIVLKNGSTIDTTTSGGQGIELINCSYVTIVIEDTSTIQSGIVLSGTCSNVTLNGHALTSSMSGTITSAS